MTGREQYRAERRELSRRLTPVRDRLARKVYLRCDWETVEEGGEKVRQPVIAGHVRRYEHRYDDGQGAPVWAVSEEGFDAVRKMRGVEAITLDFGHLDERFEELRRVQRDRGMHGVQEIIREKGFNLGDWNGMIEPYAECGRGLFSYAHTDRKFLDEFLVASAPLYVDDDWTSLISGVFVRADGAGKAINKSSTINETVHYRCVGYSPTGPDYSVEAYTQDSYANDQLHLPFVCGRQLDRNNYYSVLCSPVAREMERIQQRAGGTITNLAEQHFTTPGEYLVRLQMVGSTLTYFRDGYVELEVTGETTFTSAYYAGFYMYLSSDGGEEVCWYRNFACYEEEPEPGVGSVTGHVKDADTGDPIVGVDVWIDGHQGELEDTTDGAGNYEITGIPEGEQEVWAGGDGWDPNSVEVTVQADSSVEADDIELTPLPGTVYGKVTKTDGTTPIQGALVEIVGHDPARSDTTDSNGDYEITDVYWGEQNVRASRDGYVTQTKTEEVPRDDYLQVNFQLDEEEEDPEPPPPADRTVGGFAHVS